MSDELTATQRYNRIFILMLFGFLMIGGIQFLVVDPSWIKVMMAVAPVFVSAICICIMGTDNVRTAFPISVVTTTGPEMLFLSGRLGGWQHEGFWQVMLFLISLNVFVYVLMVRLVLALVRKFQRAKVEFIDYEGRFHK